VVAVGADVGVLLYIAAAVLKLYDAAVRAVDSIGDGVDAIIDMVYRVVGRAVSHAIYTGYAIIVGLAVIAFFAAGVGYSEQDEQQENSFSHIGTK
jgi:hypothetical protein